MSGAYKEIKRAIRNAVKVQVKTDFGFMRVSKRAAMYLVDASVFTPTKNDYHEEDGRVRLGYDIRRKMEET